MSNETEAQVYNLQPEQLERVVGGFEHDTGAVRNVSISSDGAGPAGALENLAGVNTYGGTTKISGIIAI